MKEAPILPKVHKMNPIASKMYLSNFSTTAKKSNGLEEK
jgi:hypothetical protein